MSNLKVVKKRWVGGRENQRDKSEKKTIENSIFIKILKRFQTVIMPDNKGSVKKGKEGTNDSSTGALS